MSLQTKLVLSSQNCSKRSQEIILTKNKNKTKQKPCFLLLVLKEDLPVNRQAAFTLEQLEHLETCLKEAEEKANALLEQVIPVMGTGKICCLGCRTAS